MKQARRVRHVQVHSWQDLSPNLRRIVFHSAELADYPFQCNGAHIKLLFPLEGQEKPQLPEFTEKGAVWADRENRPIGRTYTLRAYDAVANTISVDFVMHGDDGVASLFAQNVQAGQTIGVSAPAGPSPMLKPAPAYLFAGDLTALPAIHSMIEDMPADASGQVFLWLPEQADLPVDLSLPKNVQLSTFFGDMEQIHRLVQAVAVRPTPSAEDFLWFAGEASMVASLRQLALVTWNMPKKQCYLVPYWHHGETEEAYHAKRHEFMDQK